VDSILRKKNENTCFFLRAPIQKWVLTKRMPKIIDGNFLLKPCGTNDLTMFGLWSDKGLHFGIFYINVGKVKKYQLSLREKLTN